MAISGTDAYADEPDLPPLVHRALTAARTHGFPYSCRPEQGRLLRVLAGGAREAIGETGTGCGVGLAWLASGAPEGVRLVSVERDPERARIAAEVFADRPEVRVLTGDWSRITAHAPYDLLVLDGGGTGKTPDDTPADPARLLTPGGRIVVDDFTPSTDDPPRHEGTVDRPRLHWLRHPTLTTVEIPLAPDLATLVGTWRRTVEADATWRGFTQGQVVRGVVTAVESIGVFVDIDGTEGFITAPELSRRPYGSFHDVVRVGQEITAEVLDFELPRQQVRLSMAALEPDPLAEFARRGPDRVLDGTVTKVVPFGVFVRVSDDIEGFVHRDLFTDFTDLTDFTDFTDGHLPKVGAPLVVKVTEINLRQRRVRLVPV